MFKQTENRLLIMVFTPCYKSILPLITFRTCYLFWQQECKNNDFGYVTLLSWINILKNKYPIHSPTWPSKYRCICHIFFAFCAFSGAKVSFNVIIMIQHGFLYINICITGKGFNSFCGILQMLMHGSPCLIPILL